MTPEAWGIAETALSCLVAFTLQYTGEAGVGIDFVSSQEMDYEVSNNFETIMDRFHQKRAEPPLKRVYLADTIDHIMGQRLQKQIEMSKGNLKCRPLNVIFLTNGGFVTAPGKQIDELEGRIITRLNELDADNLRWQKSRHVGLQFLRLAASAEAAKALKKLDDKLPDRNILHRYVY